LANSGKNKKHALKTQIVVNNKDEKRTNREISRKRILIENVIGKF
jgi:hypothetical protein